MGLRSQLTRIASPSLLLHIQVPPHKNNITSVVGVGQPNPCVFHHSFPSKHSITNVVGQYGYPAWPTTSTKYSDAILITIIHTINHNEPIDIERTPSTNRITDTMRCTCEL
eukprot:PhF_6_TR9980/c0_g1_i1/m.15148